MRTARVVAALTVAILLAVTEPVFASGIEVGANLVTNGGFEEERALFPNFLGGWTRSENMLIFGVEPTDPHSGREAYQPAPIRELGYLSQNLAAPFGARYRVHVWLKPESAFGGDPHENEFQIFWGPGLIYDQIDVCCFRQWTEIVADSCFCLGPEGADITELRLGFRQHPYGYFVVDDISVFQVIFPRQAVPAPSPSSAALVLLGVTAIGFVRARARRLAAG